MTPTPTTDARVADAEPFAVRSFPRRPLDNADLTCDWTPYAVEGRPGFVHFDCPDCLTRVFGLPPSSLCPDRVKVLQDRLTAETKRADEAGRRAEASDAAFSRAIDEEEHVRKAHALEMRAVRSLRDEARRERNTLAAHVKALESALHPFATYSHTMHALPDDAIIREEPDEDLRVTAGDFRAALMALTPQSKERP